MQFGNGRTVVGGAGGAAMFKYTVPGDPTVRENNSLAIHGQDPTENQPSFERIERISDARITVQPSNYNYPSKIARAVADGIGRTASNLPSEIPSGESAIHFSWPLGGLDSGEPVFDDHYIRHTLPGTYTITATGMTLGTPATVDVNGTSYTRIPVTNIQTSNIVVQVNGPAGNFPSDWDIQFLRQSDVTAFDDTQYPVYHPTRTFIPEYLTRLQAWTPYEWRFMKSLRTELSPYNDVDEFPTSAYRCYDSVIPLDASIALCNYLRMGAWINFPMNATDALIDNWCDYIIANLDDDLPVKIGHGNEHWNINGYPAAQTYYGGRGSVEYGTLGTGLVTVDKDALTITGDENTPDFTTIFGSGTGLADNITINGRAYRFKPGTVTSDTLEIYPWWPEYLIEDVTDKPYYYGDEGYFYVDRGYLIKCTQAMQRVTNKFTAAGQMYRLKRVYEAQLANLGTQNAWNNAATQWGGSSPGDYIDPSTVHDGFAVNPYFGAGFYNQVDFRTAMEDAVTAADQDAFNTMLVDYFLERPITDVAKSPRSLYEFFGHRLKRWAEFADSEGMELYGYEGGHHIVHSVTWSDGFVDMFRTFLFSDEATELYEAWRDVQIPFLTGPIMKFQFFVNSSRFGSYGMYTGYTQNETGNNEHAVLDNIRQMDPFWVPENAPVIRMIPDQVWTVGVQPLSPYKEDFESGDPFSFWDFSSQNTTSWSGSLPGGTTYNSLTGQVNAPVSAATETEVTITAHNASGTDQITFNVTVVDP